VSRSVLLVAQLSPPTNLVAARRVAGLTRYLARLGHRVTVLTSAASGDGQIDGAVEVVRTPDLIATRLNWRRRHFAALGGEAPASYSAPSRLESVVIPDVAAVSWLPFALGRALAMAKRNRFDCVITSSPPQSGHLVGAALKRRGVPWIAEFRDGWSFESPRRPYPFRWQRRTDESVERFVVERASALVAVTTPIVDDLRARYGIDARLITNGFDPEDEVGNGQGLLDSKRHSLVHTGRMAISGSTPRPLIEGVRGLDPAVARRLEIVFAGPLSIEEAELIADPGVANVVRWVGALDRPSALRLQRDADSLLVITEGSTRRSVATGKLFEYLAAHKPILVLGEETEAARIVEDAHRGFSASATDPGGIAVALSQLVESPPTVGNDRAAIQRYSYPEIARIYAELIDEVSR